MKSSYSSTWKSSTQPRKQRKYKLNAPLHIKHNMKGAHLAPTLRTELKTRSIPLRKNDLVKVLRGEFRGQTGKVQIVSSKKLAAYIEGIGPARRDGTKAMRPISISNLMIMELSTDDKRRLTKYGKKSS